MMRKDPLLIDLSDRCVLKASGPDAERYLNGQVSNDVRKLTEESAFYACVPNRKGKIEADIFITKAGKDFFIDADASLRESLFARLDRYIIADNLALEDVSDDWFLIHHYGGQANLSGLKRKANRFGNTGEDFWLSAPVHNVLKESEGFTAKETIELERIRNGIAAWDKELHNAILPQEAKLENRAIDFHKGCYIGQEVISRIKSVGQVTKILCLLEQKKGDGFFAEGMSLFNEKSKEVGTITSSAYDPELKTQIGLGYAKRAFSTPGTTLLAGKEQNKLFYYLEIKENTF